MSLMSCVVVFILYSASLLFVRLACLESLGWVLFFVSLRGVFFVFLLSFRLFASGWQFSLVVFVVRFASRLISVGVRWSFCSVSLSVLYFGPRRSLVGSFGCFVFFFFAACFSFVGLVIFVVSCVRWSFGLV